MELNLQGTLPLSSAQSCGSLEVERNKKGERDHEIGWIVSSPLLSVFAPADGMRRGLFSTPLAGSSHRVHVELLLLNIECF